MPAPDLAAAAAAVDTARDVVASGVRALAAVGGPEFAQVLAYDVAHAASAIETASALLDYGAKGDTEAAITSAFVGDAGADPGAPGWGRETVWGVEPDALDAARSFVAAWRDPEALAALAATTGPRRLDDDFELVQDTFRRFAEDKLQPVAEHVHRHNADIPEEII